MARNDDKIKEILHEEIESMQLKTFVKWNGIVCRTSVTAVLGIGAMIGTWIMNHSERAYAAMHVLVFGVMPK